MPKIIFNLKLSFISNVPNHHFNVNQASLKSSKKHIKYFIYFMCFYNLILNKKESNIILTKPKIVSLPKKRKKFTLLRAPFRHKLSKKNYSLIRYNTKISFSVESYNYLYFSNYLDIEKLIILIKKYIYWFETNVQYLHRVDILLNFFFKKYKL